MYDPASQPSCRKILRQAPNRFSKGPHPRGNKPLLSIAMAHLQLTHIGFFPLSLSTFFISSMVLHRVTSQINYLSPSPYLWVCYEKSISYFWAFLTAFKLESSWFKPSHDIFLITGLKLETFLSSKSLPDPLVQVSSISHPITVIEGISQC